MKTPTLGRREKAKLIHRILSLALEQADDDEKRKIFDTALEDVNLYLLELADEQLGKIPTGIVGEAPLQDKGDVIVGFVPATSPLSLTAIGKDIVQSLYVLLVPTRSNPIPPAQTIKVEPYFRARRQLIKRIRTELRLGCRITISGIGGIGKSSLVGKIIEEELIGRDAPERFPDGIVVYNFFGQADPDACFAHILESFDVSKTKPLSQAVVRLAAKKRILVVLDGTEVVDNFSTIIDALGRSGVIITTQDASQAVGSLYELGVLSKLDGVSLMRQIGKEYARDKAACEKIYDLCGGLPLALFIAGHHMLTSKKNAQTYAEELSLSPLEALDSIDERRKESVPIMLEHSFSALKNQRIENILYLFGALGLGPVVDDNIQAGLDNVQLADIRRGLDRLVQFGFLSRMQDRFQISHVLIYRYLHERSILKMESIRGLVSYFVRLSEHRSLVTQSAQSNLIHVVPLLKMCSRLSLHKELVNLVNVADPYLRQFTKWADRVEANKLGLASAENLKKNKSLSLATLHNNLSDTYYIQGKLGDARQQATDALTFASRAKSQEQKSIAYGHLGNCFATEGNRPTEALQNFQEALVASERVHNKKLQAEWTSNIATLYENQGRYDDALAEYARAINFSRKIQNLSLQAKSTGGTGICYTNKGEFTEAISHFEEAISICEQAHDIMSVGRWSGNLGACYFNQADISKALPNYQKAYEIALRVGDRVYEGIWSGNLGHCYAQQLNWPLAVFQYQTARNIAREIGDTTYDALWTGYLGIANAGQGEHEEAISNLEIAAKAASNQFLKGIWLGNLAASAMQLGFYIQSKAMLSKCIEYINLVGASEAAATEFRLQLAYAEFLSGNNDGALGLCSTLYSSSEEKGWRVCRRRN